MQHGDDSKRKITEEGTLGQAQRQTSRSLCLERDALGELGAQLIDARHLRLRLVGVYGVAHQRLQWHVLQRLLVRRLQGKRCGDGVELRRGTAGSQGGCKAL